MDWEMVSERRTEGEKARALGGPAFKGQQGKPSGDQKGKRKTRECGTCEESSRKKS